MSYDFHVHGLWILGAMFFFVGGVMAGNLHWVEGTTESSFALAIVLIFALFLMAGAFFISSAVNARHEEFARLQGGQRCDVNLHVHSNGRVEAKKYRSEECPTARDC